MKLLDGLFWSFVTLAFLGFACTVLLAGCGKSEPCQMAPADCCVPPPKVAPKVVLGCRCVPAHYEPCNCGPDCACKPGAKCSYYCACTAKPCCPDVKPDAKPAPKPKTGDK